MELSAVAGSAAIPNRNDGKIVQQNPDNSESKGFSEELGQAAASVEKSIEDAVDPSLAENGDVGDQVVDLVLQGEKQSEQSEEEAVQKNDVAETNKTNPDVSKKAKEQMLSLASMNAVSKLAGPTPWNSEWVFEGLRDNPEIRPLAEPKAEKTVSAEQLKQLQALHSGAGSLSRALNADSVQPQGANSKVSGLSGSGETPSNAGMKIDQHLHKLNGVMEQAKVLPANGNVNQVAENASKSLPTSQELSGQDFLKALKGVQGKSSSSAAAELAQNPDGGIKNQEFSKGFQFSQEQGGQPGASSGGKTETLLKNSSKPLSIGDLKTGLMQEAQQINNLYQPSFGQVSAMGTETRMIPRVEVEGEIVKGALAMDRLSHASLENVSGGVRELMKQGGGEMKLRLNPAHLGSLRVRVSTLGDQVSLRIEASDLSAKKVLEDSMIYLKDKLSSQNLSLGRVELQLAGQGSSSGQMSNDLNMSDRGREGFLNFDQDSRDLSHQQNTNHKQDESTESPEWMDDHRLMGRTNEKVTPMGLAASRSMNSRIDGRIDIRA